MNTLSRRGALALSLASLSCRPAPTRQRIDPALSPLMPAGTSAVIGVRLDQIRKTPAWEKLFPANGQLALDSLKKRTGIDIRDDLYEVVYCLGGRHRLVLMRGKFTDGGIANSGLEPQLKLPGAVKMPYKGFQMIGTEETAVTFFNSSVAAAGKASALRTVIDNRERKDTIPTALLSLVETLPPEAHVYLASSDPRLPEGGLGGLKSLPLTLSAAKMYLDLRVGASLRGEAEGVQEPDARKLVEGWRGFLGFLRLQQNEANRQILAITDQMRVSQAGKTALLEGELPLESILGAVALLDMAALP
jgi:hypothetical protein